MLTLPIPRAVREFIDGIRALPEVAKFTNGTLETVSAGSMHVCNSLNAQLTEVQRQLDSERAAHEDTKQTLETMGAQYRAAFETETAARKEAERRFCAALSGLGLQEPSIARWMTGDEVEGDYITKRDHDIIDEINKRQEAERKLGALTRWKKQSDEPCPVPNLIIVRATAGSSPVHVYGEYLNPDSRWRHTPESLDAMEKTDDK